MRSTGARVARKSLSNASARANGLLKVTTYHAISTHTAIPKRPGAKGRSVDMIAVKLRTWLPSYRPCRPALANPACGHHHRHQKARPPESAEPVGQPPGGEARIFGRRKRQLSRHGERQADRPLQHNANDGRPDEGARMRWRNDGRAGGMI